MEQEDRLIARAVAGDHLAFETLYRSNVDRIYTLALRVLGSEEHAEDVTQEVFVLAWRKLQSFRRASSFSTWLHRLALRLILRCRDSHMPTGCPEPEPLSCDPDRDQALDLQRAIKRLPLRCRTVFVLHDVFHHTHVEIRKLLSISAGTSKAHLHRARQLLRKELSR